MTKSSSAHCSKIVPLLRGRDGLSTRVELAEQRVLDVFNIAWGTDMADDFEHITSNISPTVGGATVDLFFTDEVIRIVDPDLGTILWESDGTPAAR